MSPRKTKPNLGSSKIIAANKIHYDSHEQKEREELRARNAYRVAIGLPPV